MSDLKAFATKALRAAGEVGADATVWAYHGSTRLLFSARAVEEACAYIVERQGSKQGVVGSLE
jgi:hypothetical protein